MGADFGSKSCDINAVGINYTADFAQKPVACFLGLKLLGLAFFEAIFEIIGHVFGGGEQAGVVGGQTVFTDEAGAPGFGEIDKAVIQAIENNPKAVADYKAGKQQSLKFLMGQVMRVTGGRANPGLVIEMLEKKLKEG